MLRYFGCVLVKKALKITSAHCSKTLGRVGHYQFFNDMSVYLQNIVFWPGCNHSNLNKLELVFKINLRKF